MTASLLALLWMGCATEPVVVEASELTLMRRVGEFHHRGAPFDGSAIRHNAAGQVVERATFRDGVRHGMRLGFYDDGSSWEAIPYRRGRQHGVVRRWWPNGTLRSEVDVVDGVAHGVLRQWYPSGARFKELHLDHGVEAGLQRAWRENGALYSNYEARAGRIFGLKRSTLCFQLDDEEVVRGDDDAGAGVGMRDGGGRGASEPSRRPSVLPGPRVHAAVAAGG